MSTRAVSRVKPLAAPGPRPTRVRDLMTTEVVFVTPDAPVSRIARLMQDKAISGIPVVDEERRVVGMVTDLDLIVRNTRLEPPAFFQILDGRIPLETPGHYKKRLQHMLGTKARDVMTQDVVTICSRRGGRDPGRPDGQATA